MTLDELRARIDAIDAQIVELLNERARCALEIGSIKRTENAAFYVPERERAVYEELAKRNKGPLDNQALSAIYREIISAVRALEKTVHVGFLGPRDTFSHMAALRVFGTCAEYHPLTTVADIFTEVERKRMDYGVVPAETSTGGAVSDTLDRFITSDLKIVNELLLHISQNLLANCPLEEITQVYSKTQPFVQCRLWLKANLPNAELVETTSTAEAARIASKEPGAAAVASRLAAETYDLKTLVAGIEDVSHNYTRFFVIGRHLARPTGNDKTSILFWVKDRPGSLYAMLSPLATRGINLTKIESRPSQRRAWEYVFFIDMVGHVEDAKIKEAIEEIAVHCKELRVLGSFPQGAVEE